MSTRIYFRASAGEAVVAGSHLAQWQEEAAQLGANARQGQELARTEDGTVETITAEMEGASYGAYVQPQANASVLYVGRRLTRLQPTEAASSARRAARASASAHYDSREAPADYLFPATATIARRSQLGRAAASPVAAPRLPGVQAERGFVAVGAFGRAGDEAFKRGVWNKFVHSGRRSGHGSDANIGHRAGVILGAWSCCRNVNPGAMGCVELPESRAKQLAGLLQCRRCGLWYDPLDAASGKRAVCRYHAREPVSRRSHGAPFGDARFPCCGAVGFAHSKYASETGGKPQAWLDAPLTPAVWGCRQAPSHVPFAPKLEAGGPLDPQRGNGAAEGGDSSVWALAQLVSAPQFRALEKRMTPASRSLGGSSSSASSARTAAAGSRTPAQPPRRPTDLGTGRDGAACPPNRNSARSSAVADPTVLRRLLRVTLTPDTVADCEGPLEARSKVWTGIEEVCGRGAVLAAWREPGAEYVPDIMGAAVDGLGGGMFGFGGDAGAGPGRSALVNPCLSDLLPQLSQSLSKEDNALLDAPLVEEGETQGVGGSASAEVSYGSAGSPSDHDASRETDYHDESSEAHVEPTRAASDQMDAAVDAAEEALAAGIKRRSRPAWDPEAAEASKKAVFTVAMSSLPTKLSSGVVGGGSPEVRATMGSPATWLVEMASSSQTDRLLDALDESIAGEGAAARSLGVSGIANAAIATAETDSALFVRLVRRERPKTDRSDEIEVVPSAAGCWLVVSTSATVDDLAAQLCDRLAWGSQSPGSGAGRRARGNDSRADIAGIVSPSIARSIQRAAESFSLPGNVVDRLSFAGLQPPRGAPVASGGQVAVLGPIGGRPEQNAEDFVGPSDPVAAAGYISSRGSDVSVRFHPGMWNAAARIRQVLKVGTAEVPVTTRGVRPFASPAMAHLAAEPAIPADRPDAAVAAGVDGLELLHDDVHIRGTAQHIGPGMMMVPAKPAPPPPPEAPARPGSPRYVSPPPAARTGHKTAPSVPGIRRPVAPSGERLVTPRVPALPSSSALPPRKATPRKSLRPEIPQYLVFPATFRPPEVVAGIGNGFGDWREMLPMPSSLVDAAALAPDPSELGHEVIYIPKPLCVATAPTADPMGVPMEWLAAKAIAASRALPPPPLPIAPYMTAKAQNAAARSELVPRFAGPGSGGSKGSSIHGSEAARLELTARDLATATMPRLYPKLAPPIFAKAVAAAGMETLQEVIDSIVSHSGAGPRVANVRSVRASSPRGVVQQSVSPADSGLAMRKQISIESKKIAQQLLPVAGNPTAQEALANAAHMLSVMDLPGVRRQLLGLAGAVYCMTKGRRDLRYGDQGLADIMAAGSTNKGRQGRARLVQVPFGEAGRLELRVPLPKWVGEPHRAALNDLPCVLWLSGARAAQIILAVGPRPAAESRKTGHLMALPARLPVDDGHRLRRVYPALEFDIANTSSEPVKLSALQHLAEADPALDLHRRRAYGYRLYLPPRFGTQIDLPARSVTTVTAITADPNFYSKCMMARVSLHWRDPSGDEMETLYGGPRKKWFPRDPPGLPKPGSSTTEPFRRVATLPPPPPEYQPWTTSTAGARTAQWARDAGNAMAKGAPSSLDPTSGVREADGIPGASGDWGAPKFTNGAGISGRRTAFRAAGSKQGQTKRISVEARSTDYRPRRSAAEKAIAREAMAAIKKKGAEEIVHYAGDRIPANAVATIAQLSTSRQAQVSVAPPKPFAAPWYKQRSVSGRRPYTLRARSAERIRAAEGSSSARKRSVAPPSSPIRAVRGFHGMEKAEDIGTRGLHSRQPFACSSGDSDGSSGGFGAAILGQGDGGASASRESGEHTDNSSGAASHRRRTRPHSARVRRNVRSASTRAATSSRQRYRPQSAVSRQQASRREQPVPDAAWAVGAGFGGMVEEGSLPEVEVLAERGPSRDLPGEAARGHRDEAAMAVAILAGKGKDGLGRPESASTRTVTTAGGRVNVRRTPGSTPVMQAAPPSSRVRRPQSARVRSRRLISAGDSGGQQEHYEDVVHERLQGADSRRRPRSSLPGAGRVAHPARGSADFAGTDDVDGRLLPSVHEIGYSPNRYAHQYPRAPMQSARGRYRPRSAATRLGSVQHGDRFGVGEAQAAGQRPTSAARSRPYSAASSRTGAASDYIAGMSIGRAARASSASERAVTSSPDGGIADFL